MRYGRVPARAAVRLAWGLCAVSLTLVVVGLIYGALNYDSLRAPLAGLAPNVVWAVSFPVVGALIATHRPRNPIGWLFCAVGIFQALLIVADQYSSYALRTAPGTVPGGPLASWIGHWVWAPSVGLLFTFVLLLFPDGRLPSRRWRPVAWLSALSIVLTCGLYAVLLWPLRAVIDVDPVRLLEGGQAVALNLAFPFMVLCGLACVGALAVRFRRARGVERQQLKWFLFASAITVVSVSLGEVVSRLWLLPLTPAIPIAAGIAILRYRLYEIDRILNRTLVYGTVTAILGLSYAGLVLVLGQLFGGVTKDPPSWAVAGATAAGRCSGRPGTVSNRRLTAASTGASLTRLGRSRRTTSACAMRSTWTRSRPTW